jgi:hypothetical protein
MVQFCGAFLSKPYTVNNLLLQENVKNALRLITLIPYPPFAIDPGPFYIFEADK